MLTLLPLLRCPFIDFFGSLASRGFPSYLSLPSEGRDAFVCFPRVFLSFRLTWSSGRGGGASGRAFGARELASVSLVHSWTGDTGVALLRRTPATFYVPIGSPSSSLYVRRGDGVGESSEKFFFFFFWLCSRLFLPPHLCTLSEVVRWVRLQSAAPVSFLPGLLIFGLRGREVT